MADGLREQRRARTRRALQEAATRLFAERGYVATTVEEIASAAEVSPRTFFRYFAAKEDVVFEDLDEAFDRWEESFRAAEPGEPLLVALRRATLAVNEHYLAHRKEMDRVAALASEHPALGLRILAFDQAATARAAELIAAALGVDRRRDHRPAVIAAVCMAAVRATVASWEAAGGSAEERAAAIEDAYGELAGLTSTLAQPLVRPADARSGS